MKVKITYYKKLEWWEEGLSGKLKDKVYYQLNGKTFIRNAAKPGYNKIPTAKQETKRNRFKEAQQFAKTVINDPVLKALYEKMASGRCSAYAMAVSDWMRRI